MYKNNNNSNNKFSNNRNNNNNNNNHYNKEPKENYESVTSDGIYLYDKQYQHFTVHCMKKPYEVYIGRKNPKVESTGAPDEFKWGNPFVVGKDGDRNQVVKKYRDWIFAPEQDNLFKLAKLELKGKTLACWCAPLNCHGYVLAEIANSSISNNVNNSSTLTNTSINEMDTSNNNNNNNNNNSSNNKNSSNSSDNNSYEIDLKSAPLTMANIINKNNKYNNKKSSSNDTSLSFPPLSSSPSSSSSSTSSSATSPILSSSPSQSSNKVSFADMISKQQQQQQQNNNNNNSINNNNNLNNKNNNNKNIAPSVESENDFPTLSSLSKKKKF